MAPASLKKRVFKPSEGSVRPPPGEEVVTERSVRPPHGEKVVTEGSVRPPPGEEVVISGISGIFPKSKSTTEFSENLYNNVDMVTENDQNFHHPEAPRHLGQIDGLSQFDAQFFKVTYHHAASMEPVSRKLLEQAYMAIYDSGVNPLALKGKKIGVFIGTSYSDTSNVAMYYESSVKGPVLSGCGKSMFSNRISYWIDAVGPSYSLDCSSASSMVCLEHAYQAMTNGDCEAAVVGGGNICKLPQLGMNLRKGGMACLDGKTKCFDKNGDGPVRAEAINCLFLQKAKDAKRIYAEVYYAQAMFGLREDAHFLPTRRCEDIEQFLQNFYSNIDVSPNEVDYVEANGSAIAEADANELKAIGDVFSRGKNNPLKVGSVKSNMGHAEPASGICALTKVCLAYHKGELPANLHCSNPVDVQEVKAGRVQILQKNEPFDRGYTAVNQFTFNGINCHVLLKGHYKPKDTSKYKSSIPRLVLVSGRQEDCVNKIFNTLKSQPIDPEVIGMLHNIYQIDTPGHTCRGYTILDTNDKNETVSVSQSAEHYSGSKKPLWLVFSGMGSQWPGMATDLMKIPTFAAAIYKCHKALEPLGVDLIKVLTEPDKTIFDNILHCFIGISAVQIGLTDVLKSIGVVPDHVIGHSQGEMCCAYWDDCFTTEGMILAAYSRGIVSLESTFVKGSMAAVGLGYKDILPLCPPEIDVACHNSDTSATLSGPAEVLKKFVAELTAKGIFAREVPSANIAFHSRYIKHAGKAFNEKLKAIIKEPKLRSETWISTSVPQDRWHEDIAKYSSAEYHTNNLMSPVYFEEAAQLIPKDAVVVEVAPHGLLQAILKRSHPECVHIPLTKRGHNTQIKYFFEAIGNLYQEGFNFKMDALYPQIEYPVSTETQMISHYVDWEHSEQWPEFIKNGTTKFITESSRNFVMSIHDDEYKDIAGYIRNGNGNNIFPESAMLFLVWETLAMFMGVAYKDLSVAFRDVQFHGEAIIDAEEALKLNIVVNRGNDYFEVTRDEIMLANGFIAKVVKPKLTVLKESANTEEDDITLTADDLYKHLHAKGLTYKGEFQSIHSSNFKRTAAKIKWTDNWITFLESIIQLNILERDLEGVTVPKIIKYLTISIEDFLKEIKVTVDNATCFNARLENVLNITRCGGVEMKQIIFETKPIQGDQTNVVKPFVFAPHFQKEEVDINTAIHMNLQIVADNILDETITIVEVLSRSSFSISNIIEEMGNLIPGVKIDVQTTEVQKIQDYNQNSNLIVLLNFLNNGVNINDVLSQINKNAFILTFEQSDFKIGYFDVISSMNVQGKNLILIRKSNNKNQNVKYITIKNDQKFSWVSTVKNELLKASKVVLISEKEPHSGLFGLVKCLRKEYPKKISLVITDDDNAPSFDQNKPQFKDQLKKCLTFNVLQKGQWGSYYIAKTQASSKVKNMKLMSIAPGDICRLQWVEALPVSNCKNLVQVYFAGPTVDDAQKVVGMIENGSKGVGYDYSGLDINGKRVMGLVSEGAIASTVQADCDLLWPVPDGWSLEEAATVPWPYACACYCLAIKGQLQRGQSVFVNDGSNALGQALIAICLELDCNVYTSVCDPQRKEFLMKLFPKLQEKNVGYSQNGDFFTMVMINTEGKGCNFVVNGASGPLREAAMKCTSPFGVFMDINEFDWSTNKPLGMSYLTTDRAYMAVKLSSLFRADNLKERKRLQWIIAEGIRKGTVRPLTRVVYPTSEVPRAFNLLTTNRQRGRVLLKMRKSDVPSELLNVLPRMISSTSGTYVVVCDETQLGIEIANRLVKHGARNIMLHLKSKEVPGYMHMKFTSWLKLDTRIKVSHEKLHTDKNCVLFLNESEKLGPVHGIFVVQESKFTSDCWNQANFVKKYDTISSLVNLDVISRNNCRHLKHFVVISRSSPNAVEEYAASVSDEICQARFKAGLPAVSLRIEVLDEAGQHTDSRIFPPNITTLLNAIETSVTLKESKVITFNVTKQGDSQFIEKVSRCLGLENIDNLDSRLTVNDLVSGEIQVEELKAIVKNICKVDYTVEKLGQLRIERLKSLEKRCAKQKSRFNSKLGAFYTFLEKDEYMATNAMVPMNTIAGQVNDSNELDENATHLFLIPGFEGHHQIFTSICDRLKVRAMTFQLCPDAVAESILEMAQNIFTSIKNNFVIKSKFYLLGYSFGVNVALEVAALLEKEGHVGVIYCLDSSPDALRVQLNAYVGEKTESELQNSILEHFFQLISGQDSSELAEAIEKIENWTDKVDTFVHLLKQYATFTNLYIQNILDSAYKRIRLAKDYTPNLRLKSELILLKGVPHPNSGNLASDYGLSEFAMKQVRVFNLASDHATAPMDCRVSNIVNKFIDPELLENSKTNNCHM